MTSVLSELAPATRRGSRQIVGLGAAGFGLSVVLVLGAGRAAVPAGVVLGPGFGGLLEPSTSGGTWPVVLVIVALTGLVLLWWRALRAAVSGRLSVRGVGVVAACWTAPVLLGPPLLSLDAMAYLAQGAMVHLGLDPYSAGPVLLGADPAAARVDPMWRASPAPYGPVALMLLGAVARATSSMPLGLLLVRFIALAGVVVAGAVAASLVPGRRRAVVLCLTVANPVVLVHLVGGVHLDALVAGLGALACLALARRRPWAALVFAAVAVAVKVTMLPLLAFAVVGVWRSGRRVRGTLLLVPLVILAPFLASMLVLARPWGFLQALTVPGGAAPWYAPSTVLGQLFALLGGGLHLPVGESTYRTAGRGAALLLGAVVVLVLLHRQWRDAAHSPDLPTARRASIAVFVAAVCLPSLYAWYVAAALFLLFALVERLQLTLVVVSSFLLFTGLPPMAHANQPLLLAVGVVAAGVLLSRSPTLAILRHRPILSVERIARPVPVAPVLGILTTVGLLLVLPYAASSQAARGPVEEPTPPVAASTLRDQSARRVQVVHYVQQRYPDWRILQLTLQPGGRLRVDLVRPPGDRCLLLLDRAPGASDAAGAAGEFRPVPLPADLPRRVLEDRTCPAPQPLPVDGAG